MCTLTFTSLQVYDLLQVIHRPAPLLPNALQHYDFHYCYMASRLVWVVVTSTCHIKSTLLCAAILKTCSTWKKAIKIGLRTIPCSTPQSPVQHNIFLFNTMKCCSTEQIILTWCMPCFQPLCHGHMFRSNIANINSWMNKLWGEQS